MAGHSHWAGIKHKKAAVDAKKGKIWSKISKAIIVAAKNGGGDPETNLPLRYAIEKAKDANMPKDNIEKAIKKGTGELEGVSYEQILYEGYAPGGVAVMLDSLTDNRHRTAPEVKKLFENRGGSLGTSGCVSWMFKKKGLITVSTENVEEDTLMEIALSAGADDMEKNGDVFEITCQPGAFEALKTNIKDNQIPTQVAEISMVPENNVKVEDPDTARKVVGLMEDFEEHDDIQNVYTNFDIPDEIMQQIER
jgi:YebC/PmpR family DNA-binding regulatory protein